ncbi:MAG TPA: SigE family RNA polymerase sigma factor [Actinomycetota bacterium]|nr:SigE family RNA polymerase sigma factor [Actinomycetota bacterium]
MHGSRAVRPVAVSHKPPDVLLQLYERAAPGAYRLALLLSGDRDEADDVVQEAFVRIMRRSSGSIRPESLDAYLRRTVVNLTRSRWRRIRSQRRYLETHRPRPEEPTTQLDVESRHEMWTTLRTLPVRQRAVLFLRYYEDMSETQVAEVLGCSTNAVKCLAARALTSLRRLPRGVMDE